MPSLDVNFSSLFHEEGVLLEEFVFLVVLAFLVFLFFWAIRNTPPVGRTRPPLWPRDATGWTLLVDGSNFARRNGPHPDDPEDPRLAHLHEVIDLLGWGFQGAEVIVFCDANLRHILATVGDRDSFLKLVKCRNSRYRETHGERADDAILRYASSHPRCIAVSNDRFGDEDLLAARVGVLLLPVRDRTSPIALPRAFNHHPYPTSPTVNRPRFIVDVLPPLAEPQVWKRPDVA